MSNELIFSDKLKDLLTNYIEKPSNSLLLIGESGSGKTHTINWIAAQILKIDLSELNKFPHILRINPEGERKVLKSISIEQVRRIEHFTSRKISASGNNDISRIIIIDDSDAMSLEAQNAILKALEEPPANTLYLLSAKDPNLLLPTIRSRLFEIRLYNPPRDSLKTLLLSLGAREIEANKAITISGGLVGLALSLIRSSDEHLLSTSTQTARTILQGSTYDRMLAVNNLSKNRELTNSTLIILQQMAVISLKTATGRKSQRWQKILEYSFKAQSQLNDKGNIKLILTNLMMKIGYS